MQKEEVKRYRVKVKFALGIQNESRAQANRVLPREHTVIANTVFQPHKRRLFTWTSPDGQY